MKDKTNLKIIAAVIISVIISSSITAFAAIKFQANEIGYSTTTVADALDSLYQTQFSDNYSTEERVVGKWINGKPLYQKTLVNTESWSGTTTVTIGSMPNDTEDAFIVSGYFVNTYTNFGPSGTYFMLNSTGRNVEDTKYDTYTYYNPANKKVILLTGTNTAGSKVVATVQYTKTTDQPINH